MLKFVEYGMYGYIFGLETPVVAPVAWDSNPIPMVIAMLNYERVSKWAPEDSPVGWLVNIYYRKQWGIMITL